MRWVFRFGFMVRQSAEVENNMNSVERIVHYAKGVEQEAPYEIPETKPQALWPAEGRVELRDVFLSYRPGLPPVLKGISMNVRAGEKIGIVGRFVVNCGFCGVNTEWNPFVKYRTGAGKSSIMTGTSSTRLSRKNVAP